METLEKIISRYMRQVTCFLVIIILAIIVYIQINNEHRHAYESAVRCLHGRSPCSEVNEMSLYVVCIKYSIVGCFFQLSSLLIP